MSPWQCAQRGVCRAAAWGGGGGGAWAQSWDVPSDVTRACAGALSQTARRWLCTAFHRLRRLRPLKAGRDCGTRFVCLIVSLTVACWLEPPTPAFQTSLYRRHPCSKKEEECRKETAAWSRDYTRYYSVSLLGVFDRPDELVKAATCVWCSCLIVRSVTMWPDIRASDSPRAQLKLQALVYDIFPWKVCR